MKTIDLVYFNFGGGHRSAALALQEVIASQQRPWRVRLVNLVDVLDAGESFRKLTGIRPEDIYNRRLARGWTYGLSTELKILQGIIRFSHPTILHRLQQHWLSTKPDLVVSLVPNFNKALCESVTSALTDVPFVTVLTDLADYPPNFWIEPGQAQQLVCGTPYAVKQARAAGYAERQIWITSGMILRPAFYQAPESNPSLDCRALGLDPERPTGVVMFGGNGSMQMLRIAKALPDVQLILLCGHSKALMTRLQGLVTTATHVVVGFTSDIQHYMRLGDFFIGKPGPGSLSEAVSMGLPVITFKNASTMPQERYNAAWVCEQGVGLVLPSLKSIRAAVTQMIQSLPEFQAAVGRLDNRAVFEVIEIFEKLLSQDSGTTALKRQ